MEGWFILEMMGHIRHVGYVTEVEAFGSKLGRIEALQPDGSQVTVMFGAASVFRLTPTTEEAAREMVKPYEYKPLVSRATCSHCGLLESECVCLDEIYSEEPEVKYVRPDDVEAVSP